ncbi:MAG: ABC transporter permease [candidate division Zixibacteria bacterium]|nr:ABC transporter permease [candidate division Zixibacteria bacterium]
MSNHWNKLTPRLATLLTDYGMLLVLLLLCVLFSILTLQDQHLTGTPAGEALAERLQREATSPVLVIAAGSSDEADFAVAASQTLGSRPHRVVMGDPAAIKAALAAIGDSLATYRIIATTDAFAPVVTTVKAQFPALAGAEIINPPPRRWPTFLLADNLRNVANQITVIAIIAIGMTMVIITAGIDLSVGSLVALSAVITAGLIGQWGGTAASTPAMLAAATVAIVLCGATGAFSGLMITGFKIPPFIATLAMMQVASGIAYIISQGKPIYQIPENYIWLGRGIDPVFAIPVAVILMFVLYVIAEVLMTRTTIGRYIYAVGGNAEAARLAGVRVNGVLLLVYTVCGMLAGFGGVLMSSQLKSGAPTYGLTYELYVIAAVVVGGTSLSGGEGRMLGTLVGAFIIGVIQNGMNLTNVETYTQKVVLGLVILAAVLFDRLKQRGLQRRQIRAETQSRKSE